MRFNIDNLEAMGFRVELTADRWVDIQPATFITELELSRAITQMRDRGLSESMIESMICEFESNVSDQQILIAMRRSCDGPPSQKRKSKPA